MAIATTSFTVLSPAPERVLLTRVRAPRAEGLEGRTVGLLDNNKPGANVILQRLADVLCERGAARVESWRKSLPSGPNPYVAVAAREADIIISGVGDCGSCSSWSLRDAFEVELLGRPTVTLVSEPFEQLVHLEASSLGLPDLSIFTVPHPMATLSEDELHAIADRLADVVNEALVTAA